MVKIRKYTRIDPYKLIVSILLGLLSLLLIKYKTTFQLGSFSINLVWSLLLPLLVALSWGLVYGLISSLLVMFYPFIVGYDNGWASIIPSISFLLFICFQAYGRDKRQVSSKFYYKIYFIHLVYSLMRFLLYLIFFIPLVKLNPPFWNPKAITSIDRSVVILFAIKGILMELVLLALTDTMLLLRPVKNLFRLEIKTESQTNDKILLSLTLLGLIYSSVILAFNNFILMDGQMFENLSKLDYNFRINILFASILFFIMSGISVKYLENMKKAQIQLEISQNNYKATAEELNLLNLKLEDLIQDRTLELEYMVRQLEEYSYVISHDLKTPLRAIDAYVDFLIEDYLTEDKLDLDNLKNIRRISRDNILLIERLLDYSTTSKKQLSMKNICLESMVESIIEDFKTIEDGSDIIIEKLKLPNIVGDEVLIRQVFYNIISNSIKFKKPNSKLVLNFDYEKLDSFYIISVADNGIGFNMKYANKVFGIFERMHNSNYSGEGIGLAIIKNIIQKHKGEVWLESIEDRGTSIYIRLAIK